MKINLIAVLIFALIIFSCDKEKVKEDPAITRGRALFNDTKFDVAFGHTISCGTCHPDGDVDGKKWYLPPIHGGTPDSFATTTLFGVADTPPYLWKQQGGSDLKVVTKSVIENILLGSATVSELDDITAYIKSLKVPANPYRTTDGSQTSAEIRGKIVFESQGKCSICHSGEVSTGGFLVQIKLGKPPVDVPSLRWVFATAPYFSDHSKKDLRAVVDYYSDVITPAQMTLWKWNGAGKVTPKEIFDINLTEQEKLDLIEYLKTL